MASMSSNSRLPAIPTIQQSESMALWSGRKRSPSCTGDWTKFLFHSRHATELWEEGDVPFKQLLFGEDTIPWGRQGLRSTSYLFLFWWAAVDTPTPVAPSLFGAWSFRKQRQFVHFFRTMHNRQWKIALDTSTRARLLLIQAEHSFNVCSLHCVPVCSPIVKTRRFLFYVAQKLPEAAMSKENLSVGR